VTETFHAYRLPVAVDSAELETLDAGLRCLYPAPRAELLRETMAALRDAGRKLAERPVLEIVAAVDAAAARLADPGDEIRRRASRLIPAATGFSPAMAEWVLDRMAADWREPALRRLLEAELGDAAVLDGFVSAGDRRQVRAYGPGLALNVFAGNVPGVAVTSLVRSLLVKAPALAKLASGEPVLPVLFAEALASVDPDLADALAVTYWPGGSDQAESVVLAEVDLVVVYGGEAAVESLRSRAPAGTHLVAHGPRFSAGLVGAAALDGDLQRIARDVARAVATFDQHGCVSPHAVWVEDPAGRLAGPFTDALAAAMAELEVELPRGAVRPDEASLIHQERGSADLRGHAGGGGRVIAGRGTSWTVVLDTEPVFRPSCLNRFVRVHPVPGLDVALNALAPHGEHLQSVAIEVEPDAREDLAHRLARIGATRVTTFQRLPWPPAEWHHDGSAPLRELLRWVDLEG
jgi:acyl-CoA reductase-like NAD-dependent aldehyde dehydrogenase